MPPAGASAAKVVWLGFEFPDVFDAPLLACCEPLALSVLLLSLLSDLLVSFGASVVAAAFESEGFAVSLGWADSDSVRQLIFIVL